MNAIKRIQNEQVKAFAEACYDDCTTDMLVEALACDADETDMKVWNIDVNGYYEAINAALADKIDDEA